MPIVVQTSSDMQTLGMQLAGVLRSQDTVLLTGDMGNGKSELARGIARGLGIQGPVPSPSFTILNLYDEGRLPLYHFDWYRIESPEELFESGLDEYIGTEGITLIEWHEKAPEILPNDCLEVIITQLPGGEREVEMLPRGAYHSFDLDAFVQSFGGKQHC